MSFNRPPESVPPKDLMKPVKERVQDPLREGRQVRVERNPKGTGKFEDDWSITGFEANGNIVVVKKDGQDIQKKIEVEVLEALNPPK